MPSQLTRPQTVECLMWMAPLGRSNLISLRSALMSAAASSIEHVHRLQPKPAEVRRNRPADIWCLRGPSSLVHRALPASPRAFSHFPHALGLPQILMHSSRTPGCGPIPAQLQNICRSHWGHSGRQLSRQQGAAQCLHGNVQLPG